MNIAVGYLFIRSLAPKLVLVHMCTGYKGGLTICRQRLEQEFERCKRKNKNLTMKEFLNELRAQEQDHNAPMFHYETCDRSTVDIRSFKEYFMTTIETLLISQRRLHIKVGI